MFKKAGGQRQCCRGVGSCGSHLPTLPCSAQVPKAGLGHTVAEWASTGLDANWYHSLPQASSGPWPSPPACTTDEGEGIGQFAPWLPAPSSRAPGSLFKDGPGRTELQPHPETGRQFLSSARESLVPNQRGVQKRNGIRQKEEDALVLTEEKL